MKKIPFWEPDTWNFNGRETIEEVLKSCYPNEGPVTEKFEKEVATLCGMKYAVATTSGTVALFLVLAVLRQNRHCLVIVPDCTFIATANAARLAGLEPVLKDVNPLDLTIGDIDGSRANAVIPVHVSGRKAFVRTNWQIAEIVNDACEAFPCSLTGIAACFSFSPNKIITTGQGGMVVTNDYVMYSNIKALKDQGRMVRGSGGDDVHPTVGYNFKFTDLQAALGLTQLNELDKRIARLRRNHEIYQNELIGVPGIRLLPAGSIPLWVDAICPHRDELINFLASRNMDCRKYWHPIHRQEPYKQPDEHFPIASKYMPQAFWLPSAFTLTDDDVAGVCFSVKEFLMGNLLNSDV